MLLSWSLRLMASNCLEGVAIAEQNEVIAAAPSMEVVLHSAQGLSRRGRRIKAKSYKTKPATRK